MQHNCFSLICDNIKPNGNILLLISFRTHPRLPESFLADIDEEASAIAFQYAVMGTLWLFFLMSSSAFTCLLISLSFLFLLRVMPKQRPPVPSRRAGSEGYLVTQLSAVCKQPFHKKEYIFFKKMKEHSSFSLGWFSCVPKFKILSKTDACQLCILRKT